MPPSLSDIVEEARLSARALLDYGEGLFNPTVRLGVTGLSRAGKTVFITALVHGLTRGGRFPVFEAYASGRIARAYLAPQPDDAVPQPARYSPTSHAGSSMQRLVAHESVRPPSAVKYWSSTRVHGMQLPWA